MPKITYTDKVKTRDSALPDFNKFTDLDANEIKFVVNSLDDGLISLTTRVSDNEAAILSLESADASLQSQITSNDADISNLDTAIISLDTQSQAADSALDARITILEGATSVTQLSDLSDVGSSTPTNRNFLIANGTNWESRPLTEADISDLTPHWFPSNLLVDYGIELSSVATSGDYNDLINLPTITPYSSPLTTKGDIFVFGTADDRLPIGLDGQILQADSTQPFGLKWGDAPAGAVEYSIQDLHDGTMGTNNETAYDLWIQSDEVYVNGTTKYFNMEVNNNWTYLELKSPDAMNGNAWVMFDVDWISLDAKNGSFGVTATSQYASEPIYRWCDLWMDIDDVIMRTRNPNNNNEGGGFEMIGNTSGGGKRVRLYTDSGLSGQKNRFDVAYRTGGTQIHQVTVPAPSVDVYTQRFLNLGISDGTTIVYADADGVTDISSLNFGVAELGEQVTALESYTSFFNGTIKEDHDVEIVTTATTTTLQVVNAEGGTELTIILNNTEVVVSSPVSVVLTNGTDTNPINNYVYFGDTGVLTHSTSSFPEDIQHVNVAQVILQSAASANLYGPYKVHAWTDHIAGPHKQGHLSDVNAWIRSRPALLKSGIALTVTEGTALASIPLVYSAGVVNQLHSHEFPAKNTTTDGIYIINNPITPYVRRTSISPTMNVDSTGVAIGDNKYYTVVVWGVASEDGTHSKLMLNLPSGSYTNVENALNDIRNHTNYSIPSNYAGTGVLLDKFTIKRTNTAVEIVAGSIKSLRGYYPSLQGGGAGGGGSTTIPSLQEVTDIDASTTNKITLADGIILDATNTDYANQPKISKIDYFDRNMDINTPADGDIYDVQKPWKVADEQNAGMTTNTLPWDYQSLTGEPVFATQQIMGVISDQGSRNGKYIIGNVSMVGGIGEPVWTIGYVDEGDDHGAGPFDIGDPKNMYKKGDGTNTNGLLIDDFKPILQIEPSGTIAAVRGENLTKFNDPDRVSHNAGSMFEGFFNKDIKPVMRIQGLNDPNNLGLGAGLIQFGAGGNWEADWHISRWTVDQTNVMVNNQNFMNWVANPTWRRGLVMENGNGIYLIGEGQRIQETHIGQPATQSYTLTTDLNTPDNFVVQEVYINGWGLKPEFYSVVGQVLTIAPHTKADGSHNAGGWDFVGGENMQVVLRDDNRGNEISIKNIWNNSWSTNEMVIDGGLLRVHDIVNMAGESAFGGGSGGGLLIVSLDDANLANPSEPSVAFNTGTLNYAPNTQWGQTLTITGDGDTAFQISSGFNDDTIYFRAGNPENVSGGWNSWFQFASREWVLAQGYSSTGGTANMLIVDLADANTPDFAKPSVGFNTGTANFPTNTQWGQTLTVTGNGDTQWQMTSGFENDTIWFRTGNAENTWSDPAGSWKDWVQIATRGWVEQEMVSKMKEITSSYTLAPEDNGMTIWIASTGNIGITVPTGLPDNFECEFINTVNFDVTFVQGVGNLLISPDGTVLKQNRVATVLKRMTQEQYWLKGELEDEVIPQ